jgi:hypothetical protein
MLIALADEAKIAWHLSSKAYAVGAFGFNEQLDADGAAQLKVLLGAEWTPPKPVPGSYDVVAAILKVARFRAAFEDLRDSIEYRDIALGRQVRVKGFGWDLPPYPLDGSKGPVGHVDVVFQDSREFGLAIALEEGGEVTLAKVSRGASLGATWERVVRKAARQSRTPMREIPGLRRLAIPEVRLRAHASFPEIQGKRLTCGVQASQIASFEENVEFAMDRTGVQVGSVARGTMVLGPTQPPPVDFVFDAPFLVGVSDGGGEPYLLLWCGDSGSMVTVP